MRARLSFASSSTLARQIVQGAPADVFVSANPEWMDHVEAAGALVEDTRFDWLGNALVVVAPAADAGALAGRDLATVLGAGRVAMGDPAHVPAGEYAREALAALGLWDAVATGVARGDNVRAALALVARREVATGIVYATDAMLEPGVSVVARLPADSHAAIVYPAAAVVHGGTATSRAFLDFVRDDAATAILERAGFDVLSHRSGGR